MSTNNNSDCIKFGISLLRPPLSTEKLLEQLAETTKKESDALHDKLCMSSFSSIPFLQQMTDLDWALYAEKRGDIWQQLEPTGTNQIAAYQNAEQRYRQANHELARTIVLEKLAAAYGRAKENEKAVSTWLEVVKRVEASPERHIAALRAAAKLQGRQDQVSTLSSAVEVAVTERDYETAIAVLVDMKCDESDIAERGRRVALCLCGMLAQEKYVDAIHKFDSEIKWWLVAPCTFSYTMRECIFMKEISICCSKYDIAALEKLITNQSILGRLSPSVKLLFSHLVARVKREVERCAPSPTESVVPTKAPESASSATSITKPTAPTVVEAALQRNDYDEAIRLLAPAEGVLAAATDDERSRYMARALCVFVNTENYLDAVDQLVLLATIDSTPMTRAEHKFLALLAIRCAAYDPVRVESLTNGVSLVGVYAPSVKILLSHLLARVKTEAASRTVEHPVTPKRSCDVLEPLETLREKRRRIAVEKICARVQALVEAGERSVSLDTGLYVDAEIRDEFASHLEFVSSSPSCWTIYLKDDQL